MIHSSTVEERRLFNGGSGLKWTIASAGISLRFTRHGLGKYIEGSQITHEDGTVSWQEVTFADPEPTERDLVDLPFQARTDELNTLFDRWEAEIRTWEHSNHEEIEEELRKVADKRRAAELDLVSHRLDLHSWFRTRHERWWDDLDRWEQDVEAVQGLFRSSIDCNTLSIVQAELQANAFTAAWNRLNEHFLEVTPEYDQLDVLTSTLHTMVYTAETPMQEHILPINTLCEAMTTLVGQDYSDIIKKSILFESIKRSDALPLYEATLAAMRWAPTPISWASACGHLIRVYEDDRLRAELQAQQAGARTGGGKLKGGCPTCGKGHRGQCWWGKSG